MPSIHPKQSASSTDSRHVMPVFPELLLWKPTSSSFAVSWFSSSHARNVATVAKNLGLTIGILLTGPGWFAHRLPEWRPPSVVRQSLGQKLWIPEMAGSQTGARFQV